MTLEEVESLLHQNGYSVAKEEARAGGHRLDLEGGAIINVYSTGTVQLQGRTDDKLRALFPPRAGGQSSKPTIGPTSKIENRDVFVVYGHDQQARTSLEAMLRRWGLNPVILDQLPSGGQTIIEKLESYTTQPRFAVVLATPDDEGHRRDHPDERLKRARQNVVLELGMMLARLGRENVAILIKQATDMERPSDIQGLLYIPFEKDPDEARLILAKEIDGRGIKIDLSKV